MSFGTAGRNARFPPGILRPMVELDEDYSYVHMNIYRAEKQYGFCECRLVLMRYISHMASNGGSNKRSGIQIDSLVTAAARALAAAGTRLACGSRQGAVVWSRASASMDDPARAGFTTTLLLPAPLPRD